MRVLVVDDAAANRVVLSALLSRAGHETLVAGEAGEALTVFCRERPDAVLTDLNMPGGGEGIGLAREVRRLPSGRDVRLALMTGDAASFVDSEDLFDAIIEKPVLLADLLEFLEGKRK